MIEGQAEIERLLSGRIGLAPAAVGPGVALRAARRRMGELGLKDPRAYAALARGSEVELQALIEEVVVPESWFFRDERPFRWLAEHVRKTWVARPARPAPRALSLACAGGEEPYSIAMTLWDAGITGRPFTVDAVDVSARRLEQARRGVYSANAFRGADLGPRARHFQDRGAGRAVVPAIRATVRFHQASVLDPNLFEGAPPYDIVFCRNLLIYLDAPARAHVFETVDRLLAADGALFLGHADRLDPPRGPAAAPRAGGGERIVGTVAPPPRFVPAGDPGCFVYRRAACAGLAARKPPPARPAARPAAPATIALPAAPPTPLALPGPSLASAPAPDTGPPPPAPAPAFLEQAAELANQRKYGEALAVCERLLHWKGPSAALYHLMGTVHQAAGDRLQAENCFHRAVYLDPGHDEALLALALLAERRGDLVAGEGFRRRARRTSAARPRAEDQRS